MEEAAAAAVTAGEESVVSCECCGLEEECTGEYIGGVRDYFGGRWLCGLCSEAVKYEAGRRCAGDVEGAVRVHIAFCRMLRRGGPAERVAEGMCQMLRTASRRHRTPPSSSSTSTSTSTSSSPRTPSSSSSSSSPRTPPLRHHHATSPMSIGL